MGAELRTTFAQGLALRLRAANVIIAPSLQDMEPNAIDRALDLRLATFAGLGDHLKAPSLWHWHTTVITPSTADLPPRTNGSIDGALWGVMRGLNASCTQYLDCLETRGFRPMPVSTACRLYSIAIATALEPVFACGEANRTLPCWTGPAAVVRFEWALTQHPADFRNIDFRDVPHTLIQAALPDVLSAGDYEGAELSGLDLSGRTFQRGLSANFHRACLTKAILQDATLRLADFRHSDLRKADFRRADVSEADFCGAQLDGADFTEAKITNARWDGAHGQNIKGLPKRLLFQLWWNSLRI